MKLRIDEFEKDLIIESLEFRIENDEDLILSESLKDELQELVRKIEDDDYL